MSDRTLFDDSQPYGIARYATYRVMEVSTLLGIGPDMVRSIFRSRAYGAVLPVPSQRPRPRRIRKWEMLLIPYETLMNFMSGKSDVA